MKVLLTIEEYKERIINLVIGVANKTINPNGDDYFKFEYISWLVNQCLTNHCCLIDACNQMFLNVFGKDRNGKVWCKENLSQIDEVEVSEFNSQEWYSKFNAKAKANWERQYKMYPTNEYENDWRFVYDIEDVASLYFEIESNEAYHLSHKIFKKLYGYDYEVNKDFRIE